MILSEYASTEMSLHALYMHEVSWAQRTMHLAMQTYIPKYLDMSEPNMEDYIPAITGQWHFFK